MLLFGSLLDITDNFESLNRFVVNGDTDTESVLEKFVGFLGGFIFIAFGLVRWIPSVHQLSDLIEEQTSELTEVNETLENEKHQLEVKDRALRLSESQSKAVVENIIDGIVTVDQEGSIQSANLAIGGIFGQSPRYFLGKNIRTLVADDDRNDFDKYFSNIRNRKDTPSGSAWHEMLGICPSGEIVQVAVAFSEVGSSERPLFVGIIRDISDRIEMERIKSEFISLVSHELRTPLTSIHGSLGLVCGKVVGSISGRAKEMVDLAQNNTTRLINLVNDIFDMEKLETGNMEFEFDNVDMAALAQQAIALNDGYAVEYGIQFLLTETVKDALILGDSDRLMQVLSNLMSNAAKFSPTGKKVDLSVSKFNGSVRLSIKDRGPGVPYDFQDEIFKKFTQVDSENARAKGGTGLGLSIFKAIVSVHQGNIWFESEVGYGTTFYVDIPAIGSPSD